MRFLHPVSWSDATGDVGIDRHAELRSDIAAMANGWAHGQLILVSRDRVCTDPLTRPTTEWSPTPPADTFYLGQVRGVDWFAEPVDEPREALGTTWRSLRDLATEVDEGTGELLAHAIGLSNWHASHPRCAVCGEPTDSVAAGHMRHCNSCGADHFPRTDPAIIVLVTDDSDRALLARSVGWPEGRFSTVAGFVEPGESLEMAVRREVAEETGVRIGSLITYAGSQPWPMPSSLMLGFFADAITTDITPTDGEIAEAYWFTRAEYREALRSGRVHASTSISISRRLIEAWYGGPLPGPTDSDWGSSVGQST